MWILFPVLITVHVTVCLLMVVAVLMQQPKSQGLGAAFGGGMTENLFGAQTTHVLQTFTVWLGGAFFALTLLIAILYGKQTDSPAGFDELMPGAEAAESVPAESVVEETVGEETTTEPPAGD